jgi:hypothetical protein
MTEGRLFLSEKQIKKKLDFLPRIEKEEKHYGLYENKLIVGNDEKKKNPFKVSIYEDFNITQHKREKKLSSI